MITLKSNVTGPGRDDERVRVSTKQGVRDPQGAFVTRETVASPIRLTIWRNGADLAAVELTAQSAVNLAIDLLLAARQEMKSGN